MKLKESATASFGPWSLTSTDPPMKDPPIDLMKQLLQHARTGEVAVTEVPAPKLLPGCLLVRIASTLVSPGTERASSEFARKNIFQKAKARPDLVSEVLHKVRRDGLLSTVSAVRSRLDRPGAPGYSSSGTIVAVGEGVTDLRVGDRVACAGAGYAVHAELACVPRLLLAKIPSGSTVSFDEAAFTTVGAVALHGIRTAEAKLGDVVGVVGLGLLGQLTVQTLKAAGCRVLGMDPVPARSHLALRLGADAVSTTAAEFRELCLQQSSGHGVDEVLITAETSSSEPVNLAAELARDRGVIVAVGTVGMDIQRKLYYEKELDFRVSRSYGPGRYDSAYEQKGRDYPIGHVRWTETRNMEAFLQLLADGKLDVQALITHRFPIDKAGDAYELIKQESIETSLGVLITYPEDSEAREDHHRLELVKPHDPVVRHQMSLAIGLLGAGNFATSTLLPAMKRITGVRLVGVCAASGSHARQAGEKFGFEYCVTDGQRIMSDPDINAVVIATRHHLHAPQVLAALKAGKNVFCEKPLCLTKEDLAEIVRTYSGLVRKPLLMVGFNRRFAPMAVRMKSFLDEIHEPLALHYRVNAGPVPGDHWVQDPEQGGGRVLGEVCHFVDFLSFLVGAAPIEVCANALAHSGQYADDNVVIGLEYPNGSRGTITYLANGDRSFSKERLEVFGGGTVAVLDDFRRLELVRHGRKQVFRARLRRDKGHRGEWQAFAQAIRSGTEQPISFEDIVATTLSTLRIVDSRSCGESVVVGSAAFVKANACSVPQRCDS
jgi:predicted dehydrogenase/threonine dehydrogenase-like Zn-dependent dehydrogenase